MPENKACFFCIDSSFQPGNLENIEKFAVTSIKMQKRLEFLYKV